MLIDTHCHLDFEQFDQDRTEVLRRAEDQGIAYFVNIGSSLDGSIKSVELAERFETIFATVGIHPHEADKFEQSQRDKIGELSLNKKVLAIGEIGLDYYKNFSKPENQRPLFLSLANLAKEKGLPLVIHSRQAQEDTLKVLKSVMPVKAVIHCFSGDQDFLRECLELGFYISFTCNITYRKAEDLRDLVKLTPLNRIFLETDAPYLPPEGSRGKRNEPACVKILAEEVARLKGIGFEELAEATSKNAMDFFGIKSHI